MGFARRLLILAVAAAASAVTVSAQPKQAPPPPAATVAGARAFLDEANRELLRLVNASNRAGWTQGTYITVDTEQIAAEANAALVSAATRYAKEARRFDAVTLPPEERRQLDVLKNSLTMSAPPDPKEAEELTRLVASMEGVYGSGKYCPKGATGEELPRHRGDHRDSGGEPGPEAAAGGLGRAGTRSPCR